MNRHTGTTALAGLLAPRWYLFLILVGVLVLAATPAQAQEAEIESGEAPEAEETAAGTAGDPFIEEIVVTARKREEDVQDVPVAVSVVTGQILEDTSAGDISELQIYVPNLSIYQGRNQSTTMTAFMRGIGQADPLWGVDPGVGLYLDDVYIARPQGALLDVYDVERVEVLRGPQGTLYGKNTIGGAIKYISKGLTDDLNGFLSLTPGNHGTAEIRASIGGAFVPGKLRGKIAFASLQRDGYGTNLYTGEETSNKDTIAYRAALEWLPSDTVSVMLTYDHTEDDATPVGLTRLEGNPYCLVFTGVPCDPLPNLFDTESGIIPENGTDSDGYHLTVAWDINDDMTFKSITAYRESDTENAIDFDTTPLRIADAYAYYNDEQFTQEFQLVYDSGNKFNGVLGLYYFDGKAGGTVNTIFFESVFVTTDGYTKTDSYAIYFDGNYQITDRMNLNFGLRPTRETKNGVAYNVYNTDDSFTDVLSVTADYDKKKTFSSLAPRLGLDYTFNPDVMGYFSLSSGNKSGGFNVRAQSTQFPESAEPFDDEVFTVAEVGLKSLLANRQLVLNTAIFYGYYDDIQVSTFTSYDSDGDGVDDAFYGNFLNAGDATISGVELEWDWASRSWFGVAGNISWLDADPDTFLDEDGDGFVDTQVITNAPEFTGSLRLNVDFPAFGGLITGSLGYSYRDDSVLTNEGGPHPLDDTQPLLPLTQDSYSRVDAWISWLSPQAHWRIGIAGKNLTDEEFLTNGYNLPVLGVVVGSYGAPRTVTATVEYRFF